MIGQSPERLPRKVRDAQIRQNDILAAAEELFARQGYHHTSMEQVAARAEYATGTLYRYFQNKEELYAELLRRKLAGYLASLRAAAASQPSATEKLRALLARKIAFFHANAAFLSIYLSELESQPRPSLGVCVPEKCAGLYEEITSLMRGVVEEGIRSGEFASEDPALAASAINGLSNQVLLDASRSGTDPDRAAALIHAFVENGILARRRPAPRPARNPKAVRRPAGSRTAN